MCFKLAGRFDDGVWLVEFASLEDPSLVPQVVATVFDVRERAGIPVLDTLLASLPPRHLCSCWQAGSVRAGTLVIARGCRDDMHLHGNLPIGG